jgi:hypothetical protein
MNKAQDTMKYYLYETETFSEAEVRSLDTESVNTSIRELTRTIMDAVIKKTSDLDTSFIDKSSGDVKKLPNLEELQDAITKLEVLIDRSRDFRDAKLTSYLKESVRALLNLNKYSAEFRDAYRKKKTLLIIRYQTLVLSIFSAVSYLISVMINFGEGNIEIKEKSSYIEIAPIKTLKDFNKSVERGDFKKLLSEVTELQEYFSDYEELTALLEATDLSSVIITGLKNVYGAFKNNPKLIEFLYKAAGIITLLISLRDIIYMFFKQKAKVAEVIEHVGNFAKSTNGPTSILAKLNTFSNKYIVDAEEATRSSQREIEDENRELKNSIKEMGRKVVRVADEPTEVNYEINSLFNF